MTTALIILTCGLGAVSVVLTARYLEARAWQRSLLALNLRLPSGLTTDDVARWLNTVAAATHATRLALVPLPPVALEVVADREGIQHFLLVPEQMRATILSGLRAALPGVRLEEMSGYLKERPRCTIAAEAVLTTHRRQLAVERAEGTATALLASLQPLHHNELVVVQWIITGAGTPAPVPSTGGKHRTELPSWLAPDDLTDGEAIRAARLKQTDALLHASLRVGVRASSTAQAYAVFGRVWGQLRGLNASGVLVVRRWWLWPSWVAARLAGLSVPILHWPLLIGSHEAAGLLPIPVGAVALPGLALGAARQVPPAPGMPTTGVHLGQSNYPGMHTPLRLTARDRLQHLHVIGPTGTGKSTLLTQMVLQDIEAGHGVVVVDPKGDFFVDILGRIPDGRADDVIVLDPAATARPVGFNILQSAHDEQSRELVVDHVIHIWHELYKEFWGPRTEDVLRGALLSLINTRGADGSVFTLVEVPELLTSASFRKYVIEQPGVPAGLDSFWSWYQGIKASDRLKIIGPILNKLRAATLRSPIRLMLGQSVGLDLSRVLHERKVLLVPLSKGTLGAETAGLLGTLLLAALWQAILSRIRLPAGMRHPVFIYLDEAQDVLRLPVDLADMLAQARGLGAGFTLAHQHLGQVDNKQVKAALLGTVRSQLVFQSLRADAAELAKSYEPRLSADDLMGLAAYEFALRPAVDGQTLTPVTGTTLPLAEPVRDGLTLARASRQRFGVERPDVEAALKARSHAPGRQAGSPRGTPFGRRRRATGGNGGRS
jgi:Type IV secretion-system coupling protein DNA-binding domain